MPRRKVSTTVYIDAEDLDRLKVLSEKSRIPMAVYIRDAIREALDTHEASLAANSSESSGEND